MVVSRIGKRHGVSHARTHELAAICHAMHFQLVLSQGLEPHSSNPAGCSHKAAVYYFISHAQAFKDLSTLVAGNGADAHLGHDLEHSSIQSLQTDAKCFSARQMFTLQD